MYILSNDYKYLIFYLQNETTNYRLIIWSAEVKALCMELEEMKLKDLTKEIMFKGMHYKAINATTNGISLIICLYNINLY